jgi:hypothetical protein
MISQSVLQPCEVSSTVVNCPQGESGPLPAEANIYISNKNLKQDVNLQRLKMKLALKWLTPILLRLLSLPHVSLANTAAALNNPGSVHLVTGFYIGLAAAPQPQPRTDLSLEATTFIQLANHEFDIPIMPLWVFTIPFLYFRSLIQCSITK